MYPELKQSRLSLFIFLLIDAFLYCWLLHVFIMLRLFIVEDIIRATGWEFLPVVGVVLLNWVYRKELNKWFVPVTVADVALFLLAGHAAMKVAKIGATNVMSFLWLPLEWAKLPQDAALMWKAFPLSTLVFWMAAAGLVFLVVVLRWRYIVAIVTVVALVLITPLIIEMGSENRIMLYFIFLLPLIFAAIIAIFNHLRLFTRLFFVGGNMLVILLFYLGSIPFFPGNLHLPPGTEKLYPASGEKAAFPLQFMRGFQLDAARNSLFTTFGPTSGIVKLDLGTRKARILASPGLIRALWTSENTHELLAMEFVHMQLLRIDKDRFNITKRVNLSAHAVVAPMDFAIAGEKIFIVSCDKPSVTRFDLRTMKNERQVNFRRMGITTFNSGGLQIARDERQGRLFVELGMVNPSGLYLLLRIDPQDLMPERYAALPEGGLGLFTLPQKRSVIQASFLSKNLYEVDMDTMRVRRVFSGVLTCRSLIYDEKRDILIASSFTTGKLAFIRYSDAKTLGSYYIGKKPLALLLVPNEDAFYFGSASGIFRTDLNKALTR